jgi:DNA-binding phage protein
MARVRKSEKARSAGKELTVSHRERLIAELRADPKLAAEYLNAAAEVGDARVYLAALRTVAEAKGMAKVAKADSRRLRQFLDRQKETAPVVGEMRRGARY